MKGQWCKLTIAEAAEFVEKAESELELDHITELEDEAAEALAKFKGKYLLLYGLTALTDKGAESLGKFKGKLLCSVRPFNQTFP